MTPVAAVLHEILAHNPKADVRFWCDAHFASEANKILIDLEGRVRFQRVMAGKFRRYSHLSKLQNIFRPSILLPNLRDAILIILGFLQSFTRMLFWRPNVVFLKGGYVCLPIGLAAWVLRIPIVIHDSDAHPGLTNRILAPLATMITTGVPLEYYDYPESKSRYVGIPIESYYKKLSLSEQTRLKLSLGFSKSRPLTLFVGGGQGAKPINDNVMDNIDDFMDITDIMLVTGSSQYDEIKDHQPADKRLRVEAFVTPRELSEFIGAADLVVSRAGATMILELAAMAKPTILVPSQRLIWQIKHTKVYAEKDAIINVDEAVFEDGIDPKLLLNTVRNTLSDSKLMSQLAGNLHAQATPNAAKDLADIIVKAAHRR